MAKKRSRTLNDEAKGKWRKNWDAATLDQARASEDDSLCVKAGCLSPVSGLRGAFNPQKFHTHPRWEGGGVCTLMTEYAEF